MKIRVLSDREDDQDKEHAELGIPPLEEVVHQEPDTLLRKVLIAAGGVSIVLLVVFLVLNFLAPPSFTVQVLGLLSFFTEKDFWIYTGVGLGAQVIDGALGMAYGVSSTTFLISAGVSPSAASAGVHIAEIFTSGVSGLSHFKFGNVNRKLFRSLLIPGVLGGVLGAFISISFDGAILKPYISTYLLLMGVYILYKAFGHKQKKKKTQGVVGLALFGGFVDAIGGGGWGPVVTSTLVGSGRDPRITIGSVNAAEFFIALFTALSFAVFLGINQFSNVGQLANIIGGLIFGGIFAAPFAAFLCRHVKARTLMLIVGVLIIVLSLRTILKTWMGVVIF